VEDPEIEKIKERKLAEMLKQQSDVIAQAQISVMDLDQTNFDQTVSGGLVLVDFWAEWCGPCKSMHPIFDRMSKKYRHIKFARVNVDKCQDIAMRFAVQSIPTFIMFKNGQLVDRMVGAVGEPGIHMIAKKYQM
jgi:thioredoxin 1